MQKLGKILLLILNILIDVFLISTVVFFLLWLIFGITPEKSARWIEQKWNSLMGYEVQERTLQLSPKYQQRAHQKLYLQEINKKDETQAGSVTQPYKYE